MKKIANQILYNLKKEKTSFISFGVIILITALILNCAAVLLCQVDRALNYHRRHNVSLVFQNYNLIDYLTTEENVKLGGTKNAEDLLQKVSIPREDWKRNVLQLSGGQQQRVAIARALASEAKVLLADEPTGNLDEDTAREIIELIKKTAHELGKCVIVVTHSKQLAEEADVVLAINQGVLHEQECLKENLLEKL